MKALGYYSGKNSELKVIDVKEPLLGDDMVKIRVEVCLLCSSEVSQRNRGNINKIYRNEYFKDYSLPEINILGHEFTGIVEDIGRKVKDIKKGDRVVVITAKTFACDSCDYCNNGEFCLCEKRWNLEGKIIYGGFAKYYYAARKAIVKLPKKVGLKEGAFLEPLACCVKGVYELAGVKKDDYVLVSGPGILGILTCVLAKTLGAKVILLGVKGDEKRLDIAKDLGIEFTINIDKIDPIEEIKKITRGKGVDKAFECAGVMGSLTNCLKLLKICGVMIQIGMISREITFDYNIIFIKNLVVKGSFGSNTGSWETSLKLLEDKKIDLSRIDIKTFKMNDWEKAFNSHVLKEAIAIQIENH